MCGRLKWGALMEDGGAEVFRGSQNRVKGTHAMGATGARHKAPAPDRVWTSFNPPWMTLGRAFYSGGLTLPSVEWVLLVSSPSVAGTGAETSLLGCPPTWRRGYLFILPKG